MTSTNHLRRVIDYVRAGGVAFLMALVAIATPVLAQPDSDYVENDTLSTKEKIAQLGDDAVWDLYIPILMDVSLGDLRDTWGDARSAGRTHEGIDIMAERGSLIVSPTPAVVVGIGYGAIGGNYVYTMNAGGERFYFAHLDRFAEGLEEGDVLEIGDTIGYVGNTGNAIHAHPHLHFTIYHNWSASNPYPRLTREFSDEQRLVYLARSVEKVSQVLSETAASQGLEVDALPALDIDPGIVVAVDAVEKLPVDEIRESVAGVSLIVVPVNDLERGDDSNAVVELQKVLIDMNTGPQARELTRVGATGYFGSLTEKALAEYQEASSIYPAVGYYGPKTRSHLGAAAGSIVQSQKQYVFTRDLERNMEGEDVRQMQRFLNNEGFIVAKYGSGSIGNESMYFGPATQAALIRYQEAHGIHPALGYFGPLTRTHVSAQ